MFIDIYYHSLFDENKEVLFKSRNKQFL